MSNCDGTGRYIGCPGCSVCEEEMAMLDAAKAAAHDVLNALAFATRTRTEPYTRTRPEPYTRPAPDVDPWATPERTAP